MSIADIKESIIEGLSNELQNDDSFSIGVLSSKVDDAIGDVIIARNYPDSYTDSMIVSDLYKKKTIIKRIARGYYNKTGNEHTTSSNENGISQSYVSDDDLFSGIIPIARV